MQYMALAIHDIKALNKIRFSKYKIELVNSLLEWANIDQENRTARQLLMDGKTYNENGFYLRIMEISKAKQFGGQSIDISQEEF